MKQFFSVTENIVYLVRTFILSQLIKKLSNSVLASTPRLTA